MSVCLLAYFEIHKSVRSFVFLRTGIQPTLDPSAETFISVQCASPGKGRESLGVCGVCARCVRCRKEP